MNKSIEDYKLCDTCANDAEGCVSVLEMNLEGITHTVLLTEI